MNDADFGQKAANPINILLVEDNPADVKITLRAFNKAKLLNDIYVVSNGEDALDFVHHREAYQDRGQYPRPDLILLDLNIPKISGMDVLKGLKEDPEFKNIPIIILTSSKRDEDVLKSYALGAAGYIPKPVQYDEFVKVVDGFNSYWQIINKLPKGAE